MRLITALFALLTLKASVATATGVCSGTSIASLSSSAPYNYYWTNWASTSGLPTTSSWTTSGYICTPATSTSGVTVSLTSSNGAYGCQHGASGDTNYWQVANGNTNTSATGHIANSVSPYISTQVANAPSTTDIVQLATASTLTFTFSTWVQDPVIAIMGHGAANTYEFNSNFQVLSLSDSTLGGKGQADNGYFGNGVWTTTFTQSTARYKLISAASPNNPHGAVQLMGSFLQIMFYTDDAELWTGLQLGVRGTESECLPHGLGPAVGSKQCSSVGDPHITSFDGTCFDCQIAGPRVYYDTVQSGVSTQVSTNQTWLQYPSHTTVMVNNEVYITVSGVGQVTANASGNIVFTACNGCPNAGTVTDYTFYPAAASNEYYLIGTGLYFIRTPSGVATKYGLYISSAQLTIYLQRSTYIGVTFWNLYIDAVLATGDSGLCLDKSCQTTPTAPPACAQGGNLTVANIQAACLLYVGNVTNPNYAFCVYDTEHACDSYIPPQFAPPIIPSIPLGNGGTNPGASGDPQFVGLQGQSYQVHGEHDSIFALISTPHMHMNGLFTYIPSGHCEYNHTQCWSHPGTYITDMGFVIQHSDGREDKLQIVSGSHKQGMHVLLNGNKVGLDASFYLGQAARIHVKSHQHIHVHIHDLFIVDITNADHFFNMAVQMLRRDWTQAGAKKIKLTYASPVNALSDAFPNIPLHGLLGITWRNVIYPGGRMYEGDVMDYVVDNHDIFETAFMYSQYEVVDTADHTNEEDV
jgi:hypothetical protein